MRGVRTATPWAVFLCAIFAFTATRVEAQWHYYYFDQPRPLTLDPTRVAVRKADGGVASELVGAESVGGWALVRSAGGVASTNIDTRIATMAQAYTYASPVFVDRFGGPLIITPDILVGFEDGVNVKRAEQILLSTGSGGIAESRFGGMSGTYRLSSGRRNGFEVLAVANALAELPEVRFAEPNMVFTGHSAAAPTDPLFSDAWGLDNTGQFGGTPGTDMSALDAWNITTGDPSVIVVVIDSGVDQLHPDLNQLTPGTDTTSDPSTDGGPVTSFDGHGTTVAGCISGILNNGIGAAGIAPDCLTTSARTFIHINSGGQWTSESAWTVNTLAWAESIGARVTNNSNCYAIESAAIASQYASTKANGMVHFASSCNDGAAQLGYPSSLPSVNAIGAINASGLRASFSNIGDALAFVAPGVDIITTDRSGNDGFTSGDYTFVQGTSYASPYAAGIAALLIAANPTITPDLVETVMRESSIDLGDAGYDIVTGYGLVNAYRALQWDSTCAYAIPTAAEPVPVTKNRYLSIVPPQDGRRAAIRVTLQNLPPPHDVFNGTQRWVGAPSTFSVTTAPPTEFFGAQLQCTPLFRDWSDTDVLQIFGPDIMPGGLYRTETVLEPCFARTSDFPSYFSDSFFASTTQTWGDIVAPFTEDGSLIQPDFRDINAEVLSFLDAPTAPLKTQADIVPETPNHLVNFKDISAAVQAFLGTPYALDGPTPCP